MNAGRHQLALHSLADHPAPSNRTSGATVLAPHPSSKFGLPMTCTEEPSHDEWKVNAFPFTPEI
jgi:hypothetical protein